jgi:uncharacterized protein (DUF697 family)
MMRALVEMITSVAGSLVAAEVAEPTAAQGGNAAKNMKPNAYIAVSGRLFA